MGGYYFDVLCLRSEDNLWLKQFGQLGCKERYELQGLLLELLNSLVFETLGVECEEETSPDSADSQKHAL